MSIHKGTLAGDGGTISTGTGFHPMVLQKNDSASWETRHHLLARYWKREAVSNPAHAGIFHCQKKSYLPLVFAVGVINHRSRPIHGVNHQLVSAIINTLADRQMGGLEGLIDRFVEEGLGEVINSWISPLENQPVSDAQIRQVLGRKTLGEIAWHAQISKKEASSQVAALLPRLIDELTPTGRIPPGIRIEKRIRSLRHSLMLQRVH